MAAKARKARTLAVVDLDEGTAQEVEKEEDAAKGIPLFEGLGDEVKIEVYRMEPIEEGTIGTLAPDADEATIARRWGGGVYRVTAKGTDGKFGRKQRTVTIGGDPRFESKDATRKYRIKMGEIPADDSGAKPAAPVPGLDLPGLLSIIQASHQNSMAFMQAQLAAQLAQSQAQAQASAKMADEGRQRDREFFATMLALQKSDQQKTDPMAMVPLMVKLMELGKDMASSSGAAGEGDPVTAFIQNLPVILPQAQALISGNNQAPALPPDQQQQPAAPAAQQHQGPRLVLTGAIAEQLAKTHQALMEKGYDAETAMTKALEQLAQVAPNPNRKQEPPQAQEAAPAAAAEEPNGTSKPARATRKK